VPASLDATEYNHTCRHSHGEHLTNGKMVEWNFFRMVSDHMVLSSEEY
jgi:hypothetical protein